MARNDTRLTQTNAPQDLPLPRLTTQNDRTFVLVANAASARLFNATHKEWHELKDFTHAASRKQSKELATDRPGRFSAGAFNRHGMEEKTSPQEHEVDLFADELATQLAAHQQSFDTLHLIAAPDVLGKLRNKLSPALAKKLGRQLPRDVVTESAGQLQQRLEQFTA
jgi:protein required for attachment to host cells